MEKIIILGATGNIGSAVLKNLQHRNVEVYAGIRYEKDKEKVQQYGATPVFADFQNQESLNKALKGKGRVFLVTPMMQNPEAVTEKVITAAKLNGVKHFVRSTAAGADSKGQIQMARWAGISEDLIKVSGISFTILRPQSFLQNIINFSSYAIKNENIFYQSAGDAKFAQLDIADLGEIAAIALTSNDHFGKIYELSGLSYTGAELAEILTKTVGRNISYQDVPDEIARQNMRDNKMPEWMVNAFLELNYIVRQGWTNNYSDDYKKLAGKEYTSANDFFEKNKSAF